MSSSSVDLSTYKNNFSLKNKLGRVMWSITYKFLFRPFSLNPFNSWRLLLLRLHGAKIHKTAIVHASVKIWAPWNLKMGAYSCLAPAVDCYNQGKISIGANTTISQKTYLCASGHDITDPSNNLVLRPIIIEDQAWVAADSFIGPGVTVGQGAVVSARAAVFKNVAPWTVVGGNPSQFIKNREIKVK